MTMEVELRMTAITGVLEPEWTEPEWTASCKSLQSVSSSTLEG